MGLLGKRDTATPAPSSGYGANHGRSSGSSAPGPSSRESPTRVDDPEHTTTAQQRKTPYVNFKSVSASSRMIFDWYNWFIMFWWPRRRPGMVRTSWFCKCGEPLYIDVPADKKDAVLGYVDQVSRPGTVSVSPVSSTPPSTAETSVRSSSEQFNSPESPEDATRDPRIRNTINAAHSSTGGVARIHPGTKLFLLLCVYTGPFQIKLAHVELTTVGNDETLFYQIRAESRKKRGPLMKNPFLVPKAVEYVKVVTKAATLLQRT
ncbi:hypothetical protein PG990_013785 [Apiospora arundinis]